MNDIDTTAQMNKILELIESTIDKLDEDDAQDFVSELQEKISEILPI